MNRRRAWIAAQLLFVVALLFFLGFALRDTWADAGPRIRDADVGDLLIATVLLGAYYCLFVVGWQWILRALDVRVSYEVALQAEMASLLAKYVPGGIWTPAARVVWLRKAGIDAATPLVLSSILLEAGLSAVSGVLVFAAGLVIVGDVNAPLLPLTLFTGVVVFALHPRVFRWLATRVFRPFGGVELPELPYRVLLGLLAFYAVSWVVGGAAFLFLLRAVGGDAGAESIVFLGGVAAVGAIVAVLSIIAPSGLGVREASMYGLVLAVAPSGVALGAVVLNRILITVVEGLLLLVGALLWRRRRAALRSAPVTP
ncbi:MAG: flippase-like domain-containing protein [Actinobacteria bacterium]|nr:flippase-like domain-containing protein [Actinomycetota bacterium]